MLYNSVSVLEIDIYTCMMLDYISIRTKESNTSLSSVVSVLSSVPLVSRFIVTNTRHIRKICISMGQHNDI